MHAPLNCEMVQRIALATAWAESHPHDVAKRRQMLTAMRDHMLEMAWVRAGTKARAFVESFWSRQKHFVFAALGANRSSKSFTGGWLCFCLHLRERARAGDLYWCVAATRDRSVMGQQHELASCLPRWMLDGNTWSPKIGFSGHQKIILTARTGGTFVVEFRSADQDPTTFEQAKLSGVWADERIGEEIYDRILPRLLDLNGFFLITDIRHEWWQEQRIIGDTSGYVHAVQFGMIDNAQNLPEDAIAKALATMTEDEARMRVYGESGLMEGLVFRQFKPRHVIEPFVIPEFWPKWRAIDYGSSAPTACTWLAVSEDEKKFLYRDFERSGEPISANSREIRLRSRDETYVKTFIDPHAVDRPPAVYGMAPTVANQYSQGLGCDVFGWPYMQGLEHAAVERVKFAFETDELFVFNDCERSIRSIKNWKHKCNRQGEPLATDAYESEHSHICDTIKGVFATKPCFTPRMIEVIE